MKASVVVGVLGSDCHVAGARILEHALQKEGLDVIALGAMNSQEHFIDVAIETGADAIFVSSVYGHAYQDCQGFRDKCREAGLGDIPIYIGGNLSVDEEDSDWEATERAFLELGCTRAFPPETRPATAIAQLREDLAR